jgi:hypothetical protein
MVMDKKARKKDKSLKEKRINFKPVKIKKVIKVRKPK